MNYYTFEINIPPGSLIDVNSFTLDLDVTASNIIKNAVSDLERNKNLKDLCRIWNEDEYSAKLAEYKRKGFKWRPSLDEYIKHKQDVNYILQRLESTSKGGRDVPIHASLPQDIFWLLQKKALKMDMKLTKINTYHGIYEMCFYEVDIICCSIVEEDDPNYKLY